jgi:SOS response regulatory protein OraA/RecX
VTEEIYDALHVYAEQTAALREGARILSSGDKSAKEITRKLTSRGYSREAAEYAVEFLTEKGYLSEEASCLRIAEAAVHSKHYGKRRVLEYLLSHGYDASAAKIAAESVPEEDYAAALAYQMEKKYPDAAEMTRPAQQKMIAAMMRQGFSAGEVLAYVKGQK